MKPRRNPKHTLQDRFFPINPPTPTASRTAARAYQPFVAQPDTPAEPPSELGLVLENEISTDELNRFALGCIEDLAVAKKNQPAEELVKCAISENLPTYQALKSDLVSSRRAHRIHHVWTKQLVDSIEPLLKCKEAPHNEQQNLSDLAVQCVEQNLQMQDRIEQLQRRVVFLQQATGEHLIQVGTEIGLPRLLLEKLAKLTVTVMDRA